MQLVRNEQLGTSYCCDLCSYQTLIKANLVRHVNHHRKPVVQCSLCDKTLRTPAELRTHEKDHIIGKFECFCGKVYDKANSLRTHKRKHSLNSDIHKHIACPDCSHVFKSKAILRVHYASFHAEKKPCDVCGKMIGVKMYARHMRTHTSCTCSIEGCNQEFDTTNKLQYHVVNDHGKSTSCPTCLAEFSSEVKMKQHFRNQHGKKWHCRIPGCDHVTNRRNYLLLHIKSHKNVSESEKKVFEDEIKSKRKYD